MLTRVEDTIVAIASAAGGGGRGIVRVAGTRALDCAAGCFVAKNITVRQLSRPTVLEGDLHIADVRQSIPCAAYVWPGARSYTRQPSVEFHLPGSPPLLSAVVQQLCRAGARLAEPGEFTLRAFLAGRIDLAQADAVLGVIDADSRQELTLALKQMAGGVSQLFQQLRDDLLEVLAELEAGLDFADEDILFISREETGRRIGIVLDRVTELEIRFRERRDSSQLPRVVLQGRPNAGKSSLLNALTHDEAAIVNSQPGTTRDYLRRIVTMQGVTFCLIDTAGIDTGVRGVAIDHEAQSLSLEQQSQSHLIVLCIDVSAPLSSWDREQLAAADDRTIVVRTKSDLPACDAGLPGISTSVRTGAGLDELRWELARRWHADCREMPVVAATADRCQASLRQCRASLLRARDLVDSATGDELVALEIRVALDELGSVVGFVVTDDLLDRIFSRFCIGK